MLCTKPPTCYLSCKPSYQRVHKLVSQWQTHYRSCYLRPHKLICRLTRRNLITRAGFQESVLSQSLKNGLEELVHNQVLVSAAVATAIGQFSKPVFSGVLGKGFRWNLVIKSGGMPSTHTASIVAAATALGLERGFSDPLFGFSVVMAGIVMYDAQGVRRAVGKQAEVINTIIFSGTATSVQSDSSYLKADHHEASDLGQKELSPVEALSVSKEIKNIGYMKSAPYTQIDTQLPIINKSRPGDRNTSVFFEAELRSPKQFFDYFVSLNNEKLDILPSDQVPAWKHVPLKESVGHTKVEVLVGGLVGFFVTLGMHWKIWNP